MTNKIPVGKLNNGKTDFYPLSVGESVVTTHDIEVTSGVGTYKKGDTIPAITTFDEIVTNIFSGANNGTDTGIEVDDNLSFTSTNPVQNKVITTRLSNKVGKEEFQNALATKADKSYVDSQLNTKASLTELNEVIRRIPAVDNSLDLTSLNPVQNKVITAVLNTKCNKVDTDAALNTKADLTYVNSHLADKATIEQLAETDAKIVPVDSALDLNSVHSIQNKVVTAALNGKANIRDVVNKADKSYVDEQLAKKASTDDVLYVDNTTIVKDENKNISVKFDEETLTVNDNEGLAVNTDNIVTIGTDQTITGTKTLDSELIISEKSISIPDDQINVDPDPDGSFVIPENLSELPQDGEITSGSYILSENRNTTITIAENATVHLYIADGILIETADDGIYVKNNASLYLYNKGTIRCTSVNTAGRCSIFNEGFCYVKGGNYATSTTISGYYCIVNHGIMELWDVNLTENYGVSSFIENGYADYTVGPFRANIKEGVGSLFPTMTIHSGTYISKSTTGTIKNDSGGNLVVYDGYFSSYGGQALQNSGVSTEIYGGTWTKESTRPNRIIYSGTDTTDGSTTCNLSIHGGNFICNGDYFLWLDFTTKTYNKPVINGGKFGPNSKYITTIDYDNRVTTDPIDVSDLVDDGFLAVSKDDYVYIVNENDVTKNLNGIECSKSSIKNFEGELIIKGVKNINDPTSVVNKQYVDSCRVSVDNKSIVKNGNDEIEISTGYLKDKKLIKSNKVFNCLYNNDILFIGGGENVLEYSYSPSGNWKSVFEGDLGSVSKPPSMPSFKIETIKKCGDYIFACGFYVYDSHNKALILYSKDGLTFSLFDDATISNSITCIDRIEYDLNNKIYVAYNNCNNDKYYYYSYNGINWFSSFINESTIANNPYTICNIKHVNNNWYASCINTATSTSVCVISSNPAISTYWKIIPSLTKTYTAEQPHLHTFYYDNGMYLVSFSSGEGGIYYSVDGLNFSKCGGIASSCFLEEDSMTSANSLWVACDNKNNGIVFSSSNGTNWEKAVIDSNIHCSKIYYKNNVWFAPIKNNEVDCGFAYSFNGIDWNCELDDDYTILSATERDNTWYLATPTGIRTVYIKNNYNYVDVNLSQVSTNPVQNKVIFEELSKKLTQIDCFKTVNEYSAFELYATNSTIPAGTIDEKTGLEYKVDVPAGMIHVFEIRSQHYQYEQNVVIEWGDGSVDEVRTSPAKAQSTVGITNGIYYSDMDSEKQCSIFCTHKYTMPGRYIAKIWGNTYWGLRCRVDGKNIISRLFDNDLPTYIGCYNFSNLCCNSLKLQQVITPKYHNAIRSIANSTNTFGGCKNLLIAEGFSPYLFNSVVRAPCGMFKNCINLQSTDVTLAPIAASGSYNGEMYFNCENLETDLVKLLPELGFANRIVPMDKVFYGCKKLTCSNWNRVASILWDDTSKVWLNTSQCFTGCSDKLREHIPYEWGGTGFKPFKDQTIRIKNTDSLYSLIQESYVGLKLSVPVLNTDDNVYSAVRDLLVRTKQSYTISNDDDLLQAMKLVLIRLGAKEVTIG